MITFISTTGEVSEDLRDSKPSVEELKKYVGGDIEYVYVLHKNKRTQMIVNESGHINGLPLNIIATDIYHAFSLSKNKGRPEHVIVGNAVLLEGSCEHK